MRLQISHSTTYHYEAPVSGLAQLLRMTPRNCEGQYVVAWRLEVSPPCTLHQHDDAFGNLTHFFTAEGAASELRIAIEGVVETQDTHGVVTGALERFPPSLYLRETPLTTPDAALQAAAASIRASAGDNELDLLHRLQTKLHEEILFDTDPTNTGTSAAEAFALGRGVCQDITHIFITIARSAGVPARYVGGHFCRSDGATQQEAGHAWAEAYVQDLGWVGFDPTNGISTTDAHVRVAIGLDYLGAAPVRGMRYGGRGESMEVAVRVQQAHRQSQS